jgi:hypothetical protein
MSSNERCQQDQDFILYLNQFSARTTKTEKAKYNKYKRQCNFPMKHNLIRFFD